MIDHLRIRQVATFLSTLKPLSRKFFNRDPRVVGSALLGKVLVRRTGRQLLAARIVEVEAYLGTEDLAAHAAAGRTARNAVLFGPPGHAYVYFIYGNHYCLNISCLPDGEPGCILIRSLEPLIGVEEMARLRRIGIYRPADLRKLTSGPGRLSEAFGITRIRDNGKDVTDARSDLLVVADGYPAPRVLTTPRIGISKSVEHPLRFVIAGNHFVSGKKNLASAV